MKLGQLKAAIRASKGNPPSVVASLTLGGPLLTLALQKTALLEELDRAYPGGKAVETGLQFSEKTGILEAEFDAVADAVGETSTLTHQTMVSGQLETLEVMVPVVDLLAEEPQPAPASTGISDLLV